MRRTVVRAMTLGAPGGEPDHARDSDGKSGEAGTARAGSTV